MMDEKPLDHMTFAGDVILIRIINLVMLLLAVWSAALLISPIWNGITLGGAMLEVVLSNSGASQGISSLVVSSVNVLLGAFLLTILIRVVKRKSEVFNKRLYAEKPINRAVVFFLYYFGVIVLLITISSLLRGIMYWLVSWI
jgi:hypothetical protein